MNKSGRGNDGREAVSAPGSEGMMKKNHIFVIILIVVVTVLVALISGYFKKAVCESSPDSEEFSIFTATLDGKNMKPLITSSWQQMTHARVSPDKKRVTLTRYTNRGKDGCATENEANYDRKGQQYSGTEVLIMRTDGTDVRTLIPHQKDKMAANSYWTPDGKGIIYVSAPNEKGRPQINHIILDDNMQVKEITKLPTPDHIIPTDPHWVGEWVVFPAMDIKKRKRGIWRMRYDGSGLELLARTPKKAEMQDNDPKLSPDASKVAFMRKMKQGPFWHSLVVDVETKEIKDVSEQFLPKKAKVAIEAVPSWSSDGELLIFDHIVVHKLRFVNEIHTMRPDGSERKRIPLPKKYGYFHPSFFPGEGSSSDARIIFSTRKMSNLGKRQPASEEAVSGSGEKINIIGETAKKGINCNEEFGLYTATLDGKNLQPLITNSWQQLTHARVSPDGKWVTFSRYTRIGKDGCATEAQNNYKRKGEQYRGTEILIMRTDGTDLRVVVPARKFAAAVNSYWTPNGKGLVFAANDFKQGPRISHLVFDKEMNVEKITRLPTPEYLKPVVDPQWSGDWLVFPAGDTRSNTQGIWRMRLDGSMLEQLTARDPLLHDNDPKISPDGSKVAYSHKLNPDGTHFHFMMMDMQTKEEIDFSKGSHREPPLLWIDIMPEWSSDGKLLVFWHVSPDVKNKRPKSVLHTISPDGTGRKEIPLPEGYNYQSPVFFPGEGSGKDARIIFSTRKIGHSGKK